MNFEKTVDKIKKLNLKKGTYALFGSAPLVVMGIRKFANDVDIIITKNAWNEYKIKLDGSFKHLNETIIILKL